MVHMAHNGKEALSLWEKEPVDLVVTDVEMPVMNGLNLLKEIRSRDERVRFVILTGYDEFEYARKAIQLDVEDYILKPIDEVQLETVVKNALIKLQEMDRDKAKNMEDRIGWQKFLEGGISEEERKTFLALLPKVKKSELLSAAVMKIDSRSMRKGDMSELLSILQEEECRVIHLKADTLLLIEGFQTDYTWDGGEGETARKVRAEIHSRFPICRTVWRVNWVSLHLSASALPFVITAAFQRHTGRPCGCRNTGCWTDTEAAWTITTLRTGGQRMWPLMRHSCVR